MPPRQGETLVTAELRAELGVWKDTGVSFPVTESDIRRWALAVYWPDLPPRLYWDAEYAKTTCWGGIVAPEEFNPLAWPVAPHGGKDPEHGAQPDRLPEKGQATMNAGSTETFFARIRPGDVIRARARLASFEERQTRLGLTLFITYENEWHNQRDELVKRRMAVALRY